MTDVLSEHFDYLSLKGREALYQAAIAATLREGDVVADLGCGFGILGIQCLRAGAQRVYGIDGSKAISVAQETLARIGLGDRYECISGSTYRTTLPELVDLVICDHVGWFGLDYNIIPMLEDARLRMLRPGGRILPQRLRLVVAGVSSDKCRALADRWSGQPIPEDYRWLGELQANTKHSCEYSPEEIVTPTQVVGEIDLAIDNPASFAFAANLIAQQDVRFDGIAGWFECELADGIWMTNSPLAKDRIARNQVFLAARQPFAVKAGDEIKITMTCRKEGDVIGWTITPPGGQPRQKMSTFNAMVLGRGDIGKGNGAAAVLSELGEARSCVLALVDGQRTAGEIEEAVIRDHPQLFPSESEIRNFVRAELGQSAQ